MTVIIIIDQISGQRWYYTSITAALLHIENPVDVSNRRWSQIVKEKGYPFEHSGCRIDRVEALSIKDVREDNPPMVR